MGFIHLAKERIGHSKQMESFKPSNEKLFSGICSIN